MDRNHRVRPSRKPALLASVGILMAAGLVPALAGEVAEEQVAVILTDADDIATLVSVGLLFERLPDSHGLAPAITAAGVYALGGNDLVLLSGVSTILGRVREHRDYSALPEASELLLRFAAGPVTSATAIGVDGGDGDDRLGQSGQLAVTAEARLDQVSFAETVPGTIVQFDANVEATAIGFDGGRGNDQLTADGQMEVQSRAVGERTDLNLDFLAVGGLPQSLVVTGRGTGLAGGAGSDMLETGAGANIVVISEAEARGTRVSVENMRLSAPANATVAEALAAGLGGGTGSDWLTNAGRLEVRARADSVESDVSVIVKDLTLLDEAGLQPEAITGSRAVARALGLAGGEGDDRVDNRGLLVLGADASYRQFALTIGDGGIATAAADLRNRERPQLTEPPAGAIATLVGLAGGGFSAEAGRDTLISSGAIEGEARAVARSDSLFLALPLSEVLGNPWGGASHIADAFGIGLVSASTDSYAAATGLLGGGGADILSHTGSLRLGAHGRSETIGASLVGLDAIDPGDGNSSELFSINLTFFNLSTLSQARAAGLSGGEGNDLLENSGDILLRSSARADTATVNLSLGQERQTLLIDAPAVFSRTWADATSVGLDGGGGRNGIANSGAITVEADARARQLTASISTQLVETGVSGSLAYVDSDIRADARATGISDPGGGPRLDAPGSIAALARADTQSVTATLGLGIERGSGAALAGAVMKADQRSSATARGIDIGAGGSMRGAPPVVIGATTADAGAEAERLKVGVTAASATKGAALSASLTSSRTEATADAAAVTLRSPATSVQILGDLDAVADATARNADASVGLAIAEKGVAAGVVGAKVDTFADARAAALDATLAGSIVASGRLSAEARGRADSAAALFDLAGGQEGVALGATLLDARTRAHADAAAVRLGNIADLLETEAPVRAIADATARSVDAGLSIATESKGVAAGVALARADTSAESHATAIDLGGGNDLLLARGALTADARTEVRTISATVGLGLTGTGVGAGAAAVDSGVRGRATATAVDGGAGRDSLLVLAPVSASARSDTGSLGISLGLGLSPKGVSVGLAGLKADSVSRAVATGLSGGTGADRVEAAGPVTVRADSRAHRTDIALASAAALKGAALTGTMLLAETLAQAVATGLAGDTADGEAEGDGDDIVISHDAMRVEALADARANSVGISGPLAVGFTASLLKAELDAEARAVGLSGGGGRDTLWNRGPLAVEAQATARGFSLNLATVGAALDRTDTRARAVAFGMSGGSGNDLLVADGPVSVTATADARSLGISVVATGFVLGRQTTEAEATATGLSGGSGHDWIEVNAPVTVEVKASAPQRTINIGNFAGVLGDARVRAEASGTGIDAGFGNDRIVGAGPVAVTSEAEVQSLSVTFAKTGLANAQVGSRALASATAIDAGPGWNDVDLAGPLSAAARTRLSGINIAANVSGGGRADTSSRTEATAVGLAAGPGHLAGRVGAISSDSWARADDVTVAASLAGYSEVDASIRATAVAAGIDASGTLALETAGRLGSRALATADSRGGNLGILNISLADLAAHGRADAAGLRSRADAGTVAWRLAATDSFTVSSEARARAFTIPIDAFGVNFVDTGARAFADAALVQGSGVASHDLEILSPGTVRAVAKADLETIAANIGGVASLDHRGEAVASAIGISTAGGADSIAIRAPNLLIQAEASIDSALQRFAFGSVDFGRLDLRAVSDAALARTGPGNDVVENWATVTLRSTAVTEATGIEVQGLGVSFDKAGVGAAARALAAGIEGGAGNDRLLNNRSMDIEATARSRNGDFSFQLAGLDVADAASRTEAVAVGIDGGDGDDFMWNAVSLRVRAVSTGFARNTSIALLGALLGDARQEGRAHATGMDGGAGRDLLRNFGLLDVSASAVGRASNLNVTGAGAAIRGGAHNLTEAIATGMAGGGGGRDDLFSNGEIRVSATAGGGASSSAIASLGAASADVSAMVRAAATGLAGGEGDDRIEHRTGPLDVQAGSAGGVRTLTATGGGVTFRGRGESVSRAEATGIDAGGGDNLVLLAGPTTILASAGMQGGTLNVTAAGVGRAELRTAAESLAVGVVSGDGDDDVEVDARLTTLSVASLASVGRSITVFGTGQARADSRAEALGTGIDLGSGRNRLTVSAAAPLGFESRALADVSASTFTLAGTAATGGVAMANARQTGIAAGDGDDRLAISAPVDVRATAELKANGSSMAIFGVATTGGDFGAEAHATGLASGAGDDDILLSGRLLTHARATTTSDVSSYAFTGVAGQRGGLVTRAIASGIDGGSGANTIRAAGLDVRADATTGLTGSNRVEFGATSGNRSAILGTAMATGVGVSGDRNSIELTAPSRVTAQSHVGFAFTDFVLAGVANGRNAATAEAVARGIAGGSRPGLVLVARPLVVEALPTIVGSGTARASLGGKATAASESVAIGRAVGIETVGSVGLLRVPGTGEVDVRTDAWASSSNDAVAGSFFSDGRTRAQARVDAGATGIALAGSFSKTIEIEAPVEARVLGFRPGVETGIARSFAESRGVAGIANSTEAMADSVFIQRAFGLDIEGGFATVRISGGGNLRAEATGHIYAEAKALGSQSLFTGDSWARANGINEDALAVGLRAGGNLDLENRGSILVLARPTATLRTEGRNSGIKNIGANARANAVSFLDLDGATAIGIEASGLAARIDNHGIVSARALPEATAFAVAGRLQGIEPVNAAATASSYVNGTRAWGIRSTTPFATTVLNSGLIRAVANPYALADSSPTGAGLSANATARATAEAINTRAYGIETAGGNDVIENNGTISVQSLPLAVAATRARAGTGGNRSNFPEFRAEVYVAGIVTGAGNDVVINRGTIATDIDGPVFRAANNISLIGRVAIDTGPGNDQVFLLGGSTQGDILLGPGDDLLHIENSPSILDGVLRGGPGRDMLRLVGAGVGNQVLNVAEFEDLVKTGNGGYLLSGFAGSLSMSVAAGGWVRFSSTFALPDTHQIASTIHPNGAVGQLLFPNTGVQPLRGGLAITALPGVYVNGTTWDVLQSGAGFSGSFSTVALPPPTALVSFSGRLEGGFLRPTRYSVRVDVLPMAGLVRGAGGPVESFAAALDTATPLATGTVWRQIAALQGLQTSAEVRGLVTTLAPQMPQLALQSGVGGLGQGLALLARRPGGTGGGNGQGLTLALRTDGRLPAPGGRAGWAIAEERTGAGLGARRGSAIAMGEQFAAPGGVLLGIATVHQRTEHALAAGRGDGLAETSLLAAHAEIPLGDRLEASLTLAGGTSSFTGGRAIIAVDGGAAARMRQRSRLFAAALGTQWRPGGPGSDLAIEAGLDWQRVAGEASREIAASGLALHLDGARSERLDGELALRWQGRGALLRLPVETDLRLGWRHRLGGGGAKVAARFADMPDHQFTLDGFEPERDRLALDVAARFGRQDRLGVEAVGHLRTGEATPSGERRTSLGAALRLTMPLP